MDRALVEQARAGDREAFAALVRSAMPWMETVARLTVRDADAAQDALQETLIRAWRDLPGLRDPGAFDAWLRRLLVRACIDELRRWGRQRVVPLDLIDVRHPSVPDASQRTSEHDALERAFRRLSPQQRAAAVLFYVLDLPIADIAASLGLPAGTVKSHLARGRDALRAALDADARPATVYGEGLA